MEGPHFRRQLCRVSGLRPLGWADSEPSRRAGPGLGGASEAAQPPPESAAGSSSDPEESRSTKDLIFCPSQAVTVQ